MHITQTLGVSAALLLLAACSPTPELAEQPEAPAAEVEPAPAPEPEPAPEPGPEGTRANPAPSGSTIEVSDNRGPIYEVTLGEPVLDATDVIMAENPYNEPPPEGMQYIMLPVTYKYVGQESGTPQYDVTIDFVSAAGTTHATYDHSAVIPNDVMDINELYNGGTGEGNIAIVVPTADIEEGTWAMSTMISEPYFIAVK